MMAQEQVSKQVKEKQKHKEEKQEKKQEKKPDLGEALIRIFGFDVPASKNVYTGLTRIKGISWAISNAVCLKLKIPHSRKISDLSKSEIAEIENFLENLDVPDYLKNRRNDIETGKTSHNYGSDLDIIKDFDIKRLKKIKSYKGVRHSSRLPVRGQRTRSHFRHNSGKTKVRRSPKQTGAAKT